MSRDENHKRKYSILNPYTADVQCEGNDVEFS